MEKSDDSQTDDTVRVQAGAESPRPAPAYHPTPAQLEFVALPFRGRRFGFGLHPAQRRDQGVRAVREHVRLRGDEGVSVITARLVDKDRVLIYAMTRATPRVELPVHDSLPVRPFNPAGPVERYQFRTITYLAQGVEQRDDHTIITYLEETYAKGQKGLFDPE
jgi:hypothetical protein